MKRLPVTSSHRLYSMATFVLLTLLSCAAFKTNVSYYDTNTYRNLTELKPVVARLYDSFSLDSLNSDAIENVRLKFDQMSEYEKGKGQDNADIVVQIDSLKAIVERSVTDRITAGKWNSANMANSKESMFDAFDIAIKTEAVKNKNSR